MTPYGTPPNWPNFPGCTRPRQSTARACAGSVWPGSMCSTRWTTRNKSSASWPLSASGRTRAGSRASNDGPQRLTLQAMATLRPQRPQLVYGLIAARPVGGGQLVGLGRPALLGFELLAQLLHLLLHHRGLGLMLLCPRLLVAQLVPLLKQCLFLGLDGPLAGLELMG